MGLLDWVDPAREWWKSRPDAVRGLLGGAYQLATDPEARKAAMARQPAPFQEGSGQSMFDNAMAVGPQGLLGKIVYHGSPHKFDKFDASKIGTGEGAQAYGHGVYLADAEDVARGYQAALGGGDTFMRGKLAHKNGTSSLSLKFDYPDAIKTDAEELAADAMSRFGNKRQAIGYVETRTSAFNGPSPETKKSAIELLSNGAVEFKPVGSLYKADLPDEWIPKMLDWDKPIGQQPELQRALGMRVVKETEPSDSKWLVEFATGKKVGFKTKRDAMTYMTESTGGDVYRAYDPSGAITARQLKPLGIPGIRYLDGGSRSAGQGSYNYVVFPGLEDQIKILERNGIPLNGLLGGK